MKIITVADLLISNRIEDIIRIKKVQNIMKNEKSKKNIEILHFSVPNKINSEYIRKQTNRFTSN